MNLPNFLMDSVKKLQITISAPLAISAPTLIHPGLIHLPELAWSYLLSGAEIVTQIPEL
jgi:hypothetical protein